MMMTGSPVLLDPYGRQITCLRVSVTDRCNYRCVYCMPAGGIPLKRHDEILRFEQIAAVVREAAGLGIFKIKITGGEPLVKKDIEKLVGLIAAVTGIVDLGMTTNGSLLTEEKSRMLKKAGLMRVNISLDTLDRARFAAITRGGDLNDVLRGVDAALAAGLRPVKINMVMLEDTSRSDVAGMKRFCDLKGIALQTISRFSLDQRENTPAAADKPPPCEGCNRLRLTADGYCKPCLFSNQEIKIDFADIRQSLLRAVLIKPERGTSCDQRAMSQIGG